LARYRDRNVWQGQLEAAQAVPADVCRPSKVHSPPEQLRQQHTAPPTDLAQAAGWDVAWVLPAQPIRQRWLDLCSSPTTHLRVDIHCSLLCIYKSCQRSPG
jgi:hypothetical protein